MEFMEDYIDDVLKFLGMFAWIGGAIAGFIALLNEVPFLSALIIWGSTILAGSLLYGMGSLLFRCAKIIGCLNDSKK